MSPIARRSGGKLDRIQTSFVNAMPINHEIGGETAYSVRELLENGCSMH